jgi:hypothetical protein
MASHLPVNHPLRPLYRLAAAVSALFALVIGALGAAETSDLPLFQQDDNFVFFGLVRVNLGHSLLMLGSGVLLLLAVLIGRNVDRVLNLFLGGALMMIGLAALPLLRTEVNYLNFDMGNVIIAMVLGIVLFTAGLYGRTARR